MELVEKLKPIVKSLMFGEKLVLMSQFSKIRKKSQ
ncbi:MAG: hypothetical protein U0T78_06150 [Cloacibacterium normanense]